MTAAAPEARPLLCSRFRVLEVITGDPIERVVRCLDTQLGREVLLESGGSALDKLPTVDGSAHYPVLVGHDVVDGSPSSPPRRRLASASSAPSKRS